MTIDLERLRNEIKEYWCSGFKDYDNTANGGSAMNFTRTNRNRPRTLVSLVSLWPKENLFDDSIVLSSDLLETK